MHPLNTTEQPHWLNFSSGRASLIEVGSTCLPPKEDASAPEEGKRRLLQLMHVLEHASRDANDENFQASPGFVLHATGDINDHVLVKFNLKPIEQHPALAVEDVIDLVRPLMIM